MLRAGRRFTPKKVQPIPVRARDGLRDYGQRAVAGAVPLKAVLKHEHAVRLALPDPDQPGAGFHARGDEGGLEPALSGRNRNLSQLALGPGRQAAERLHLELIGDGADQEVSPERARRRVAVESLPALAQSLEAEIGQPRDLSLDPLLCHAGHVQPASFALDAFPVLSVR